MWRVYLEINGLTVNPFVIPCYSSSFVLNLALYFPKVKEPSARNMMKLSPFSLACHTGSGVWNMHFVSFRGVVSFTRYIYELQNQRSPRNNTATSRKEVSADDVFKNGGFPRRLGTNHDL